MRSYGAKLTVLSRTRYTRLLWNRYWRARSSVKHSKMVCLLKETVQHLDQELVLGGQRQAQNVSGPQCSISHQSLDDVWDSYGRIRNRILMPASSVDPEKVQQWQEEEFQRRLRGGYEAAQQRLGQVVSMIRRSLSSLIISVPTI